MITAKANEQSEVSNAIVVSFSSFWKSHIEEKKFSTIIRKRVPLKIQPKWTYFHVNAPVGEICGRAVVNSVTYLSKSSAINIKNRISLDEKTILKYMGSMDSVGCYDISDIELAKNVCTAENIKEKMIYNPPQSFFYISKKGLAIIDDVCGF